MVWSSKVESTAKSTESADITGVFVAIVTFGGQPSDFGGEEVNIGSIKEMDYRWVFGSTVDLDNK